MQEAKTSLLQHTDPLTTLNHAPHSVEEAKSASMSDDGFDDWNLPQPDPALSTMINVTDVSESANIISSSAETDKDSMPDLGQLNNPTEI